MELPHFLKIKHTCVYLIGCADVVRVLRNAVIYAVDPLDETVVHFLKEELHIGLGGLGQQGLDDALAKVPESREIPLRRERICSW
jgi:hypothetical protein